LKDPRILSSFPISEIPRIPRPAGTNEVVRGWSGIVTRSGALSGGGCGIRGGTADDLDST